MGALNPFLETVSSSAKVIEHFLDDAMIRYINIVKKGINLLRKIGIIIFSIILVILGYFTINSAKNAFRARGEFPKSYAQQQVKHRLVLITKELDTPFWDKVKAGALEQAKESDASLEVWGSYGNNREDFIKKFEIAIHSKVDGIIIQGLDDDDFIHMTKIKAAFYGIPVIYIANDVNLEKSLRKTYVGSDQYLAGKLIANQLISDMGKSGEVVLLCDNKDEYYQQQRLHGMLEILNTFPEIQIQIAKTQNTEERVTATTSDTLNKLPGVDAFIAVNANMAGDMIKEIGKRSQVDPYFIYSFDDGSESLSLFKEGKLDGMIEQSPKEMGKLSVMYMMQSLNNPTLTLDMNGYLTDIRLTKAVNPR
ncbi:sugar ABC transporter substrate-binding protein [Bacillus marasmi]|uniref:sugar ABC transporter substrate-binding protein n=1 Tax=Bacillus marasmi TaxID=1926279 RepID=UPI00319E433C